jgi:hypothetical protein
MSDSKSTLEYRIGKAVDLAMRYGQQGGARHRLWVIDQMLRALVPDYIGARAPQPPPAPPQPPPAPG